MLELGRIPLRWQDRMNKKHPLIIAGGPCTVNPLPMSPFVDAFLVGEAEEAVLEFIDLYKQWKASAPNREDLLKAISDIEGFMSLYADKNQSKEDL